MRRLISVFLTLCATLAFAACDSGTNADQAGKQVEQPEQPEMKATERRLSQSCTLAELAPLHNCALSPCANDPHPVDCAERECPEEFAALADGCQECLHTEEANPTVCLESPPPVEGDCEVDAVKPLFDCVSEHCEEGADLFSCGAQHCADEFTAQSAGCQNCLIEHSDETPEEIHFACTGEKPASEFACTADEVLPLSLCVLANCRGADDLASCAVQHCAARFQDAGPDCQSCLLSHANSPLEELASDCVGIEL